MIHESDLRKLQDKTRWIRIDATASENNLTRIEVYFNLLCDLRSVHQDQFCILIAHFEGAVVELQWWIRALEVRVGHDG